MRVVVTALDYYLNSIKDNLRLDLSSNQELTSELEAHIEDRFQELMRSGLSEEEAANSCVRLLGSAKVVARQIYEEHSQGTWRQALLASIPHLLFGLLFTLNWWQGISWLLVMLVLVLSMTVYGWRHGKPAWIFPWLGYSLVPVVVTGLLLLYLPVGRFWMTILLYIPLALWLLLCIIIQTIKKDWLYSSLMLFPVPIILGWFLVVQLEGRFPEFSIEHVHNLAPLIGTSFLTLAVTVVAFIRLRQRWLKVMVVYTPGLLILIMATCYAKDGLGPIIFIVLALVLLSLFLTPALMERRIRQYRQ